MATGGGRPDRRARRAGRQTDRQGWWHPTDRSTFLAVSLALVTLFSVVAVPVSGAGLAGTGAVASIDDGVSAGDPLTKGGPPAGQGSGGGSGGSAGGGSSADGGGSGGSSSSGTSSGGGSNAAGGGSGDSGGDSGSSSTAGATSGGGGSSDASSDGGASNGGPSAEAGAPGHSNGGGNDADTAGQPSAAGNDDAGASGHPNAGGNDADARGPPDHSKGDGNGDAGSPEHANGESRSEGPSVSVSAGKPAGDRGADGSPGRSGGGAPSSVVEVSVNGAEAGDDVDLDVSPPAVEDDAVAFEGISVTVKRDGDFTMRVTNSREALPGSPSFDPEAAAESLGRIRLDHSITNEEVEDVSYNFRVSKAHLRETGTDFEDVALYRHEDDGWNELPTDVVGETATHYVLSADSPGMSEFAVGAKRPAFDAYWADVADATVDDGESVTVSGRVTNHGGADGVYDAQLVVDGEVVEERSVTIAAGGTRQVNFRTRMDRPGARQVSFSGVPAGEVTVDARPADSSASGTDGGLAVVIDRLLDVGHALDIVPQTTKDA